MKIDIEDITKNVKHSNQLPKEKATRVVLARIEGKSYRDIAKEQKMNKDIANQTAIKNKALIEKYQDKRIAEKIEIEQRIINKGLKLLLKKFEKLEASDKKLDNAKATELSRTIQDIFNIVQVQSNQPTAINKNLNITELQTEFIKTAKLLQSQDKMELLQDMEDSP